MQFHTEAARDRAVDAVKTKKLEMTNAAGGKLRIERGRTELQRERNWAMRKAEEILNEELKGQSPVFQFHTEKGQRKLTSSGVDAFVQSNGERGRFVGAFAHLQVPP